MTHTGEAECLMLPFGASGAAGQSTDDLTWASFPHRLLL